MLRRTGDRRLVLRGLVFLADANADPQDVDRTEAVLVEADELADGDPAWGLTSTHGDCAQYKGDDVAALAWYIKSLAWTSSTDESHRIVLDMGCIALSLARLGAGETALEVLELLRLERERIGRPGDLPSMLTWLQEAVDTTYRRVGREAAKRAAERARNVPVSNRAAHAIELTNRALVAPRPEA